MRLAASNPCIVHQNLYGGYILTHVLWQVCVLRLTQDLCRPNHEMPPNYTSTVPSCCFLHYVTTVLTCAPACWCTCFLAREALTHEPVQYLPVVCIQLTCSRAKSSCWFPGSVFDCMVEVEIKQSVLLERAATCVVSLCGSQFLLLDSLCTVSVTAVVISSSLLSCKCQR